MTDLEQQLEAAKLEVRLRELDVQSAELKLTHGERYLAGAREQYGLLKIDVEIAKAKLAQQKTWVEKIRTDVEIGYVKD